MCFLLLKATNNPLRTSEWRLKMIESQRIDHFFIEKEYLNNEHETYIAISHKKGA